METQMLNSIFKRSKKIITALLITFLITTAIFLYWNKFKAKPYSKPVPDTSANTVSIEELYNEYKNKYAYSRQKTADDIYLGFSSNGYEKNNFLDLINEINSLKVDIHNIKEQYQSQQLNLLIYKTINYTYEFNQTERIEQGKLNDILANIKKRLNYSFIEVNNDNLFDTKTRAENDFIGYLDRSYLATVNNKNIQNIGSFLSGTYDKESRDLIRDISFNSNVKAPLETKVIKDSIQLKTYDEIEELLKGDHDFITYDISLINKGLLSEHPTLQVDLDADYNSTIIISSFDIDYFYQKDSATLVPLLRLDGSVSSKSAPKKVSFWVWFIK